MNTLLDPPLSSNHYELLSLAVEIELSKEPRLRGDIIVFWSGKQLLKSFHMFPVLCLCKAQGEFYQA